ncbi:citryl-CoA lyase [Streptomyces sp. NPDC048430]|uniref:citryl-CoA lyase n=1 Tax=Streptomyces sp. NPDC048430 TaxID=3155388 RepID=UPI00342D7185
MPREPKPIRSDIAWSTTDRITIRGLDLPGEILGHLDLAEFSFLQLTGRRPTAAEGRIYTALLITLVEHGLTPSAIAARMTYAGAPEAMQAAVAAGLCGLGSVFVGTTEGSANMLAEALADDDGTADLDDVARRVVSGFKERRAIVPGVGHPLHKPIDPRTPRLFEIAEAEGVAGRYVELMKRIGVEATRTYDRELPVNATGAIGALSCEIDLPLKAVRGLGVMARAIGLVGHILEESEQPMALQLWQRIDREASAHIRTAT